MLGLSLHLLMPLCVMLVNQQELLLRQQRPKMLVVWRVSIIHRVEMYGNWGKKLFAARDRWREEQKNTMYQKALHTQNILFIPMAVEMFGE